MLTTEIPQSLSSLPDDTLLTSEEAATYLKKSVSWLEKDRQTGKAGVPYHKMERSVRYKAIDLREYIDKCRRVHWQASDEPYVRGGSNAKK